MAARKVLVAGGTGFIGTCLIQALADRGDEVVVLTRGGKAPAGARAAKWDARTASGWSSELDGAYAIVNLAGETIQQRWTPEARKRILQSRVDAVGAICEAIGKADRPPERWVNASAIGYYGDRGETRLNETSPSGDGFLAETCVSWEDAVVRCPTPSTQRTRVRIGVVLGKEGALPVMAKLARFGLGGTVGTGEQFMSWIHIDDLVGMFLWVLDQPRPPEVVNGTAPEPVTNRDFMREVRQAVHAPIGIPAPAFGVRLVGNLLGPDADLLLTGARAYPQASLAAGYAFRFTTLPPAIAAGLNA